uniref:Iroquois homeobox 4b n=1 Tax=Hucho hucho TaxID=62062 RepID=A0A4W5Q5I1_9TELE
MAYPQLGYPYSPTHQFLMSTSSLANCFEPGGRSLLDSGVTHPSPQPLRCPVYESRLLGSPGQEIPTPAIGLGVYGAGYGKSQGYYGTCGGDATALYGTLESKDGTSAHVGASQTPAYYPYDYAFGQYPYDRYGYFLCQIHLYSDTTPLTSLLPVMGHQWTVLRPGGRTPGCRSTRRTRTPPRERRSCWPSSPR